MGRGLFQAGELEQYHTSGHLEGANFHSKKNRPELCNGGEGLFRPSIAGVPVLIDNPLCLFN